MDFCLDWKGLRARPDNGCHGAIAFPSHVNHGYDLTIKHLVTSTSSVEDICIIGGGRYGRTLARVAHNCGEYRVHLGSHSITQEDVSNECPDAIVHNSYPEAIAPARIVVLAVPPRLVRRVVATNLAHLKGRIVIDISNPDELKKDRHYSETIMHNLNKEFPELTFVKCFNTVAAEELQDYQYPIGFTGEAFVCGDNDEANEQVLEFVHKLGIPGRILGRAEKTKFLESFAASFLEEWRRALFVTLGTFLLFYTYTVVYYCMQSMLNWARFIVIFQAVFGQMGLNLAAVTYLPGIIAHYQVYSHYNDKKPVILAPWLYGWMRLRAKLGTLSVYFVLLHAAFAFFSVNYTPGTFPIVREISAFLAITGTSFGMLLCVLLVPGLKQLISYREWRFFQRYLGWGYLLFGTAHVCLIYGQFWVAGSPLYFKGVPPASLIAVCVPFLVIFLKIVCLGYIGWVKLRNRERKEKVRSSSESNRSSGASIRSWLPQSRYSQSSAV